MSLISQNTILKNNREKSDEEPPAAGSPLTDTGEANESGAKPESEPTVSMKKKKKSGEIGEKSRMEQEKEKEMRRLESSLFGALYAPPEFRKEAAASVPDAPLFFVDWQ